MDYQYQYYTQNISGWTINVNIIHKLSITTVLARTSYQHQYYTQTNESIMSGPWDQLVTSWLIWCSTFYLYNIWYKKKVPDILRVQQYNSNNTSTVYHTIRSTVQYDSTTHQKTVEFERQTRFHGLGHLRLGANGVAAPPQQVKSPLHHNTTHTTHNMDWAGWAGQRQATAFKSDGNTAHISKVRN